MSSIINILNLPKLNTWPLVLAVCSKKCGNVPQIDFANPFLNSSP